MGFIWNEFLYKPLFNLLIFLYQYNDVFSLGLAVIYLTIIIRVVLLPFTFFTQRNKISYVMLNEDIEKISQDYKHDPEQVRQETRKAMKKYKIRPWAKAVVLGVQALILVLLYQVFLGGINNKFDALYPSVPSPDFVNLIFFGVNLGQRNFYLALFVGVILFIEIAYNQRIKKHLLKESDIFFKYLFPIFSVAILTLLPAVKSVFILTSIFFTVIVSLIMKLFIKPLKNK